MIDSASMRKFLWAAAAAFGVYLAMCPLRPMLLPDEYRYAEIAREMLVSGNWVVPQLAGVDYLEKPVLGYWLIAASFKCFGVNAFALRLPGALATLLTALIVRSWGRRAHSKSTGNLAALCYLLSALVFVVGTYGVLDAPFAFLVVGALYLLYCAIRSDKILVLLGYAATAGVLLGLATLIKGLLAPLLIGLGLTLEVFWLRRVRFAVPAALAALALMAITVLPWGLAIERARPGFWCNFIYYEHLSRFMSGTARADHRDQPFWFYVPVLIGGLMPVLLLMYPAWHKLVKRRREVWQQSELRLAAVSAAAWLIFFSLSSGKLGTYILVVYPALSLLTAVGWRQLLIAEPAKRWKSVEVPLKVFAAALALAAILLVLWQLILPLADARIPALRQLGTPFASYLNAIGGMLVLLASALCYFLAAAEKPEYFGRKFGYFCAGTAILMLCYGSLIPQFVLKDKSPDEFLRAVYRECGGNSSTRLLVDNSSAALTAWSLGRTDLDFYYKPGELAEGIKNADKTVYQAADLPQMVTGKTALLLVLSRPSRLENLPPGGTVYRRGKWCLVHYPEGTRL